MIHPQSATVVHQQLDLLATAVFRWTGQAGRTSRWTGRSSRTKRSRGTRPRRRTQPALEHDGLAGPACRSARWNCACRWRALRRCRRNSSWTGQGPTAERLRAQGGALEQRAEVRGTAARKPARPRRDPMNPAAGRRPRRRGLVLSGQEPLVPIVVAKGYGVVARIDHARPARTASTSTPLARADPPADASQTRIRQIPA